MDRDVCGRTVEGKRGTVQVIHVKKDLSSVVPLFVLVYLYTLCTLCLLCCDLRCTTGT
jgi:hypothetical protein